MQVFSTTAVHYTNKPSNVVSRTPVMKTKMTIDNLCCNGLVIEKIVERSTPICRTFSSYYYGLLVFVELDYGVHRVPLFPLLSHISWLSCTAIYTDPVILVFSFDKTLLQYNLRNKYTRREFHPSTLRHTVNLCLVSIKYKKDFYVSHLARYIYWKLHGPKRH